MVLVVLPTMVTVSFDLIDLYHSELAEIKQLIDPGLNLETGFQYHLP
jgi:hypothetical protein